MRFTALALLLVVAVASAQLAPLLHADSPKVIPGSYIVVLKQGLEKIDRDAHVLALQDAITAANDEDSEIVRLYDAALLGFHARLSKELLNEVLAHPNVEYVEADQIMTASATVTQSGATWGIARVSVRDLPYPTSYPYDSVAGAGVSVYVVDTGIYTKNQDFEGRATSVFNAFQGSESGEDLNGHGTHCAGTIGGKLYGIAKKASLMGVKVLDKYGSGTNTGVIGGVDYVVKYAIKGSSVASMSLGGGVSTALDTAVNNAVTAGIPFAVAAGNDNDDACDYSPARAASAVTVGATDSKDSRASYSNYGKCVDIFAPGTDITSDWIGSVSATNKISGTSMATPHVAGVMAMRLSIDKGIGPTQLTEWFKKEGTQDVLKNVGTGSPNLMLYSPSQ